MHKRIVAPVILALGLVFGPVGAAPAIHAAGVDVDTTIREALQRDPELVSLYEEMAIRDSVRQQAGFYPNPALEFDGATGGMTGSSGENRISIGVTQEIVIGGKIAKREEAAKKGLEEIRLRIKDRERTVAAATRKLINDIVLGERRAAVAEKTVELVSRLEAVAKERLEAGDIPEYEFNLARAEKTAAETAAEEAASDVARKRAELSVLSGIAPDAPLAAPEAVNHPATEEQAQTAAATRPDIVAAAADVARAEAGVAASKADLIPNITVGVGWQRESSTVELPQSTVKDADHLLGLKLSMPIPLFNRNQGAIAEAVARRSAAQLRRTLLEERARREVTAAVGRLTATGKAVEKYEKKILPQLEENVRIVQEAFQLGEVGIQAVIQEHRKYTESYEKYVASLEARAEAVAALELATGAAETGKGEKP